MSPNGKDQFPGEVIENIGHYVYRLIDPRNGETFYVGRGQGNRIFNHINQADKIEGDEEDNRIRRIRQITNDGLEVLHVIHRHGMTEKEAKEVESAIIDAYPGLTNSIRGYDAGNRGVMTPQELINKYRAQIANFNGVNALLVSVNRSADDRSLYDAARYAWGVNLSKAKKAEVIFAVRKGLIRGAFIATEWLEAKSKNFPGFEQTSPGLYGFIGHEAHPKMSKEYINRRLPDNCRLSQKGFRYTYR